MSGTKDLSLLSEQRRKVEDDLWQVQLSVYPDSKRLTLREVYSNWLAETAPGLDEVLADWDDRARLLYSEVQARSIARVAYAEGLIKDHHLNVAHNICTVLQYPAFVFYECGKRPDGSYAWRGCRVGPEPNEYISGFGRY